MMQIDWQSNTVMHNENKTKAKLLWKRLRSS